MLWRWDAVKAELDKLHALGSKYRGRRLYLLYNPATGRTNGTTHNFFATMTLRPAGIVDRPHRHTAAAVNFTSPAPVTAWSPASATRGSPAT